MSVKICAWAAVSRVLRGVIAGGVSGVMACILPLHAHAQSFNPTTTAELVSAVQTATTTPGPHIINLVAGRVYLVSVHENGDPATGQANAFPLIPNGTDLTINGNGATIARDTASGTPAFRLFTVNIGGALHLRDLTLRGGLIRGATGANGAPASPGFVGGDGNGGALFNSGMLDLRGVTLAANMAVGGVGGTGGTPSGGGSGGAGGVGGTAHGGAIYNSSAGTAALVNSTLVQNSATGGSGGDAGGSGMLQGLAGDGGPASGGAIYSARTLTAVNATIARNDAATGPDGNGTASTGTNTSDGGGIYIGGTHSSSVTTMTNSLLAANTARTTAQVGSNCGGLSATDGGHNLEFNPAITCGFTVAAQTGDPLLGPLASNGGPTQTLAILSGSAAIAHGDTTVCAGTASGVDQRGFPRPAAGCAIGAFEPQPAPTITGISPASGTTGGADRVTITGAGFLTGATVAMGATAIPLTTATATTLVFAMPPHVAGSVMLLVNNPDGQSAAVGYTYGSVTSLPPKAPTAAPLPNALPLPASRPASTPAGVPGALPPHR